MSCISSIWIFHMYGISFNSVDWSLLYPLPQFNCYYVEQVYLGTNGRNTALFPRWKHDWCLICSMTECWFPSILFPCLFCHWFCWRRPFGKFRPILDYKFTQLKGNQKLRYYFKITNSVGNFGSEMRRCCRKNTPLILTLDHEYVKTLKSIICSFLIRESRTSVNIWFAWPILTLVLMKCISLANGLFCSNWCRPTSRPVSSIKSILSKGIFDFKWNIKWTILQSALKTKYTNSYENLYLWW